MHTIINIPKAMTLPCFGGMVLKNHAANDTQIQVNKNMMGR
ncbi:MAG: hypothetical protein N3A54_03240 [Patescibacteria group bacterium]|nr:hypothetical protein [Patescibacteria group bacterium]